jgi:hypothetical protein
LPDERNKKAEVGDRLESGESFFAQTSAFKADELLEGKKGRRECVGLSHEPASHAARSVSSATESWSQDMTHISGQTSNIAKKLHGGLTISMHSPLISTGEVIFWLRIAFVSKLSVWGRVRKGGVPTCLRSRLCMRA